MITVAGMGLVFGALALLWGVIALFGRILKPPASMARDDVTETGHDGALDDPAETETAALTAERARVAVMVAGALMANAIPLGFEPSPGPTFEHGRTAPAWVTTNRARAMRPWQPPRATIH